MPEITDPPTPQALLAEAVELLRRIARGQRAEAAAMLNTVAAATFAGMSRRAWQAAVSSGRAPKGVKLGKLRLWPRAELEAWIAAGCPPVSAWKVRQASRDARLRLDALGLLKKKEGDDHE